MAGKSDPSIYNERTSIGSSDDLDEYGVWVKTEPQDLSTAMPDMESLPDFDMETDGGLDGMTDDFDITSIENVSIDDLELPGEDLDMPDFSGDETAFDETRSDDTDPLDLEIEFEEISEDIELPDGLAAADIDADGFTEVSMDDFLGAADTDIPESIDFGDLDSTVSEIESLDSDDEPAGSPASGTSRSPFSVDLSTQLLQKIADELSSIKKEISGLKTELSVVRGEVKAQEDGEKAGFFDEEDDEKIALTGDELDNILNTANFTEESAAEEETESALSENEFSSETITQDALPDEPQDDSTIEINFEEDLGELGGALKIEDELTVPDSDDFDIELDLTPDVPEASSELKTLREEGALPITEAPEDTSYLDEEGDLAESDLLSDGIDLADGIDLGGEIDLDTEIDLSGAVIDEADLSGEISDNPVSEPSVDNISIDLDMEEASSETADEEAFETEMVSLTAGPDDFVFETEETLEIPMSGVDETPPQPDSGGGSLDDILPAVSEDIDLDEPETSASTVFDEPQEFDEGIPNNLKQELKTVLSYMDQLLESLPEEKIEEFAKSEYFETYKKLFEELGLV